MNTVLDRLIAEVKGRMSQGSKRFAKVIRVETVAEVLLQVMSEKRDRRLTDPLHDSLCEPVEDSGFGREREVHPLQESDRALSILLIVRLEAPGSAQAVVLALVVLARQAKLKEALPAVVARPRAFDETSEHRSRITGYERKMCIGT